MNSDVFLYRQMVAQDGYKVITPNSEEIMFVASNKQWRHGEALVESSLNREYVVRDHRLIEPDLYLTFASLGNTQEEILEFANKYGLLGCGIEAACNEFRPENGGQGYIVVTVEPVVRWYNEILDFKKVLDIIGLYQKSDKSKLKEAIKWDGFDDGRRRVRLAHEVVHGDKAFTYSQTLLDEQFDSKIIESIKYGNIDTPVMEFIRYTVNRKYLDNVKTSLVYTKNYTKLVHKIIPKNLLGFMWNQLARDFENSRPYRSCECCGKPFVGKSAKKKHCSNACKSKAYRARRAVR